MKNEKKNIRELSAEEISAWLTEIGEKPFRSKQIIEWLWKKGAGSWDEMTNVSLPLREQLAKNFSLPSISIDVRQKSKDGTIKLGFKTHDGQMIEGVLIPRDDRLTACVSSQVGCSLTCSFCATGRLGLNRNLNFDEIFDQVVLINREAMKNFGKPLTNIVFMGMGEPLLNYSQVIRAIDKITSPQGLGISPRRITVSTAGIAKMIKKLGDDKVRFRLALSLHAANDKKRNVIMPINETNNIRVLIEALDYFFGKTKNRISYEYVMLRDFNDSEKDALELAEICRKVPVKVNLIEYNTVAESGYKPSDSRRVLAFQKILIDKNITATIRRSRGRDIDAACGQLANKSSVSGLEAKV